MSHVATPGPDGMQFVAAGEAYAINAGGSFLTRPETNWYSQMFATLPAGHQHLLHYKDPDTGTLRKWQWNNLLAPGSDYTITIVYAMNDHHLATATVIHNPSGQTKQVLLVPMDIIAHRRGTVNAPGAKVPRGTGTGEYGYETVMMENADSESAPNSTQPDYSLTGNLNEHRMANDHDLVKVVLRWPKDLKINGARLELRPRGLEMDPRETVDERRYVETETPRLNFYKPDGTRLSETDLIIENLGNPGNSYLAEILDTGELTLFVEGGERFGIIDPYLAPIQWGHPHEILTEARDSAQKLGGAMLNFEFTYAEVTSRTRLLIYRGGYLHFRMPTTTPPLPYGGVLGVLEFRDGKGRVSATEIDEGELLFDWSVRSGRENGAAFDRRGGGGHTPPGWYLTYQRTDITGGQNDQVAGTGQNKRISQGSYVRWAQDDETNPEQRYTTPYEYNGTLERDRNIGEPTAIKFKWQMEVIPPTSAANRDQIQIHPDGKQNGTNGCIGIQRYNDCDEVDYILRHYHGLKVYVELE